MITLSEQRNTFSLETSYKQYDMKSRLEARTAYLLDALNIEWEYEQSQHLLTNGEIYIPDFYLPEHEQFIECKGDLEDPSCSKPKNLAEESGVEAIILSHNKAVFLVQFVNEQSIGECENINLVKCSKCENYSFVPNVASWHCRVCEFHNGNNDIKIYSIFDEWDRRVDDLRIESSDEIDHFIEMLTSE